MIEFRNVYKEFRCWFIMNRKKFLVIGLLGLFVISMFAGVVADAYDDGYDDGYDGLDFDFGYAGDFEEYTLGYDDGDADYLFDQVAEEEVVEDDKDVVVDTGSEPRVSIDADLFSDADATWLKKKYDLWLKGVDWETGEDLGGLTEMIKWFVLILVVLLIYSALTMGEFPENPLVRAIIAGVTGILSTFFITSQELITTMQAYTALGVALTVFFPIMILGFFTITIIKKGKPTGIFLQQILWIIYSVYLFIKTGSLLLLKNASATELASGEVKMWFLKISASPAVQASVKAQSGTMLMVLLITSVAVFAIMVIGNKTVRKWVGQQQREAESEAFASKLARSKEFTGQTASQMSEE